MGTDNILERPLVYQLLLVQLVFDRKESFESIADALNEHPLLLENDVAPTDSDDQVKEYYDALLKFHKVQDGGEPSKAGVPRRTTVLAELLYRQYSQSVLDGLEEDRKRFVELYNTLDKTVS